MSFRFIIYVLGRLLVILAGVMCVPAVIALVDVYSENVVFIAAHENILGFLVAILSSYIMGIVLMAAGSKGGRENSAREGFAIVTFGWIVLAFFGAIPLFMHFLSRAGELNAASFLLHFTNAYFENMSGFTGTGSTILTDIEALPDGLLFWRSMTQWLGGLGVATLALAIFPTFGVAAYQIFRSESPGPDSEKLTPRLARTVKVLWGVYLLLTVLQTTLLLFGGMSLFDSVCHAFTTIPTGGFSTRNSSIGAFNSAYIEWVIISFMFLSGMNFMIHFRVLFGRTLLPFKTNREFHFYACIILAGVAAAFLLLRVHGISPDQVQRSWRSKTLDESALAEKCEAEEAKLGSIHDTARHAGFQVVSMVTTTGYVTADFDTWPNFLRYLLVFFMFVGGCAGSTAGGIKMVRMLVLLKVAWREIRTMIQPRLISPIKIAGKPIADKLVYNILGFIALYMLLFAAASAIMCLMAPDIITALTAVVACISNIGPGLAGVGAAETFAWIPTEGKWVLILCMLLGRLEIFTVLIALAPRSYRR